MRDEWIKKCVALALLVIAASMAYYFVIFLPRERTARLEMERQEKLAAGERERQERLAIEQREREKLEMQRQDQLAAEQREHERLALEEERLELDRQEKIAAKREKVEKAALLIACLTKASAMYHESWTRACWELGNADNNCLLPTRMAEELTKDFHRIEDGCYKAFPQR